VIRFRRSTKLGRASVSSHLIASRVQRSWHMSCSLLAPCSPFIPPSHAVLCFFRYHDIRR
jgi:hypothetical protein